jgi:hypothetical protein
MNVFESRSRSFEMNNSTEDIETIVNIHLGNSLSSLDIDNVFHDDTSATATTTTATAHGGMNRFGSSRDMRQRKFQMQMQMQRESLNGYGCTSSLLNKSSTLPEDVPVAIFEHPGSLAKIDRGSTLGSFSVYNGGSFDSSSREVQFHIDNTNNNCKSNSSSSSSSSCSSDNKLAPLELKRIDFNLCLNDKQQYSYDLIPELDKCKSSSNLDLNLGSSKTTMTRSNVADMSASNAFVCLTAPADVQEVVNNNNNTKCSDNLVGNSNGPILAPHAHDILMGRGGRNNQWSGNELLRQFASELCGIYSKASKRAKPTIAWVLVTKMRSLQPPGRYVIFCNLFFCYPSIRTLTSHVFLLE